MNRVLTRKKVSVLHQFAQIIRTEAIMQPRAAQCVTDEVAVRPLDREIVNRDAVRMPRTRNALDNEVRASARDDLAADADLPPPPPLRADAPASPLPSRSLSPLGGLRA
jgi:hypothetical protein